MSPHAAGQPYARAQGAPVYVAILDGDTGFVQVLTKRLDRMGCRDRVLSAAVPVDRLVAMRFGALVFDLALLGPLAWEYLERVTRELPALPVIVCTGPSTVAQRVRGLRMGADDWVSKPCHPEEVIARLEAAARRQRHANDPGTAKVLAGEVAVHPDEFQVFANGASIDLTRREFDLIQLLAAAEGRVLEREEIYQRIWGYTMAHGDRSVDVFVRKVRWKLRLASPDWNYVHTHFGVGYRFAAEPATTPPRTPSAAVTAARPAAAHGGRVRESDGRAAVVAVPAP
jgi:DNA-binding response OmpR family regulator